jgi:ABC-type nitrate/sulfonate/bicarbonate transport system substrate-binding protein
MKVANGARGLRGFIRFVAKRLVYADRIDRRRGAWNAIGAAMVVALLSPISGPAALAQSNKPLELIVFPGGFNWPIWVAQDKGLFSQERISVKVNPTPNSVFQLTGLIDGKFDIAMTALDNVIAYAEGQGAAPTTQAPDIVAFMGGDNGFLRLVTVPEVRAYGDLKGKQLSVDALTTGYAFVLRELLAKGGLQPSDYELVPAGGIGQRFEALLEKKHAGTLLISPFEAAAEARGFNRLADAANVLGHYQGLVGAARRDWARAHETELVGYIRSYVAALDWLYDPSNKAEAIAILRKNLPNISEAVAEKSYEILLHPSEGFTRKAELNVEGVRKVLELRSRHAEPKKQLDDPAKYYDLKYYQRAIAR